MIRKSKFIPERSPVATLMGEAGLGFYPFEKFERLGIQANLGAMVTGYNQDLNQTYRIRFVYLYINPQVSYLVHPQVTLRAGPYLARQVLMLPSLSADNYKTTDWGFSFTSNFFEFNRIGFFTSIFYGCADLLSDYPEIDRDGNFLGSHTGLRNTTYTLGVFLNIYNEKL